MFDLHLETEPIAAAQRLAQKRDCSGLFLPIGEKLEKSTNGFETVSLCI
jgi:hypothetical protein